jgi:hypothetical protein
MKKKLLLLGAIALMSGAALSAQVTIGSHAMPQATLDIVGSYSTDAEKGKAFRLDDGNQAPGKVLVAKENGIGTWEYYARNVHEGNKLAADTTWLKRQAVAFTYTGLNVEVPVGKSIVKLGQIIRNHTQWNGYVAFIISTVPSFEGQTNTSTLLPKEGIANFPRYASFNLQSKAISTDQVEFDITNTNATPTTIYIWACVNGLGGVISSEVPDADVIDSKNSFGVINAAGENFIAVYY